MDRVERDRWRKPTRLHFETFARRFIDDYLPGRNLKRSTLDDYTRMIEGHVCEFFGAFELSALEPQHVDRYIGAKMKEGLAPKTIRNHLRLLSVMFKVAMRWNLVARDPPRARRGDTNRSDIEMEVLARPRSPACWSPAANRATGRRGREPWWLLAAPLVVALGTAMRGGEIIGLRWRDLELARAGYRA